LLSERGYVAVPGLGTFVSRRVSSTLNDNGVVAPGATTSFESYNGILADDDLCASLSRALECDTTQASAIISDDIEGIRREISLDGMCAIPSCGILRSNGATLTFETATYDNWLQDLAIEPLGKLETADATDVAAEQRREAFMRSLRRTASSAAAIAIFALIAFIFSQMPGRQTGDPQVASMGFEKSALPVQPTVPARPGRAFTGTYIQHACRRLMPGRIGTYRRSATAGKILSCRGIACLSCRCRRLCQDLRARV